MVTRLKKIILHEQKGLTLLEVLVAVGILGAVGVVFLVSMNTAYKGVGVLDEQLEAEALVRSQLEEIKNGVYQDSGTYPVTVALPSQYSMLINVEVINTPTCSQDGNCNTLQKITVSIYRPVSGGQKPVLSVSAYKAKV